MQSLQRRSAVEFAGAFRQSALLFEAMISKSCRGSQERVPLLPQSSFPHRILLVDDDAVICEVGKLLLETQGYEVITAGDGFEALSALKRSLPDLIISDLSMPNMSGFEFLSVVRRRFSTIPVIVISAEFSEMNRPESVLADVYFSKGHYEAESLFAKILELLHELPSRPRVGRPDKAAVWVKNNNGIVAVTCTDCLRTFPVADATSGVNTISCLFCPCTFASKSSLGEAHLGMTARAISTEPSADLRQHWQ